MNEAHVFQVIELYRQRHLLFTASPVNDTSSIVCRFVKGWLQYLPKEERIIFYEYCIKNLSLDQIAHNLEKRWILETARTEHELDLRLSRATQRIVSLMNEQFPNFNLMLARF